MKVFMNNKGQYLVFNTVNKGGFSTGQEIRSSWTDDINKATVAEYLPRDKHSLKWETPSARDQVILALEAVLETTRKVTLCKS